MHLPRVVLAIDRPAWAFDHIARALVQHLADEFLFEVVPYHDLLSGRYRPPGPVDLLVAFWWPSAKPLALALRPRHVLTCLFDGYSTLQPPALLEFRAVCRLGHVAIVNRGFFDRAPPGQAVSVIEDAVDTELFTPRPLPATFTAGWTGNSDGASTVGGGEDGLRPGPRDLKGLSMIRAACARARVPLATLDLSVDPLRRHDAMPRWYDGVSVYVCASEREGGPNPVLEALACGRWVVSTAVGLVPDLAAAGAPVLVVERSVGGLGGALAQLAALPRGDLAARAEDARRVALLHDRAAKVGQWREAITTALGEVPRAPA